MNEFQERDLRKARFYALWGYVGILIPLIGWILAGISNSLLKDIPGENPKTKKAVADVRNHIVAVAALSSLVFMAFTSIGIINAIDTTNTNTNVEVSQPKSSVKLELDQQKQAKQQYLNTCLEDAQTRYNNYLKNNADYTTKGTDGETLYNMAQDKWDYIDQSLERNRDECYRRAEASY